MKLRGSYRFGHEIVGDGVEDPWCFVDTGELLPIGKTIGRLCPKCGKAQTPTGHDPCIAHLPGVRFACCGHGMEPGYIKFSDGRVIRGHFEIEK